MAGHALSLRLLAVAVAGPPRLLSFPPAPGPPLSLPLSSALASRLAPSSHAAALSGHPVLSPRPDAPSHCPRPLPLALGPPRYRLAIKTDNCRLTDRLVSIGFSNNKRSDPVMVKARVPR